MKYEKLKAETIVPQGCALTLQMYPKSEVDTAIDELKTEHHRERHEYIEMVAQLRRENAELKVKLDKAIAERNGNQVCIDALKAKLEDVQASAYAESVDAGMRERKLKRALWLARAERAVAKQAYYDVLSRGVSSERGEMYDVWNNVERKCLQKAKEYK